MNKKLIIVIALSAFFMNSCKDEKKSDNPFFSEYETPFHVPPFDKIKLEHYMPAFIEGIKQKNAEIEAIVDNPSEPNFENTILALDKTGWMLTRVMYCCDFMTDTYTSDKLDSIADIAFALVSKNDDDIMMNAKLFQRIKSVYEKRNSSNLNANQICLIEKYFRSFEHNGANLSKDDQEKLRKINDELSVLTSKFAKNLMLETNKNFHLVIENKKDLEGLPQNVISAAAADAKDMGMDGKWVFGLSKSSMNLFLQYASNRDLREKIYCANVMRGNNGNKNDNKEIVAKIVKLRCELAKLFGFNSFAEYRIADNMAKTPEEVNELISKLWSAAIPVAKNEAKELQKIIDREGGNFKLQPWDWWYYAEKLRKEKYDIEDNELKPYFSITNVRDGMFGVATNLYGITFTKVTNLPVYMPEVETFQVKEKDGSHLGIIYFDYYSRNSKRDGGRCTPFQKAKWHNREKIDPTLTIACNFQKPIDDSPSLLSMYETSVLFHEFGHALQVLFSEGKYDRTIGEMTEDYQELPSQVMVNWAFEPEVIKSYAKHYKTGECIPDTLVEKYQKSQLFNQGFKTIEVLAATMLDLAYHSITEPKLVNINEFEKQTMDKIGLLPEVSPRYCTTNFMHIFSGPYAATLYAYTWAEMLDADAFEAFKEKGDLYDQELAAKFRKYCLAEIGGGDCMDQYCKFRGQNPSVTPLLKRRGLIGK